ncbi:hypothetical protein BH09SUM1_BH09SUM1_06620 [soil metagenome]
MIRPASLLLAAALLLGGCATVKRDRCYLPENRYIAMKAIFEQTGSYQRAAQAMEDEEWSHCEINTFRYRLRQDLHMDDPQFDSLFLDTEPSHKGLGVNPGRVERAIK